MRKPCKVYILFTEFVEGFLAAVSANEQQIQDTECFKAV